MAIGDSTELAPGLWRFELLASATATSAAPSAASDGLDLNVIVGKLGGIPERMKAIVASTAGSGTMTVTCRLWGYYGATAGWAPIGTGTDADKGKLNAATATAETGTDSIKHAEELQGLGLASRLYLQVTAIGGTDTAVTAWLVGAGRERVIA